MEKIQGEDAHQFQETDDGLVRTQARECEYASVKTFWAQQPLFMPALESDSSKREKGAQETDKDDLIDANVEISDMIYGSDVPFGVTVYATSGKNSSTRLQKRKVSVLRKQAQVLDRVEYQRRLVEIQGIGTCAVDFILSNQRCFRLRSRCSSIQQRFFDCIISNEVTTAISVPQKINFLA
ncbi:hypothetical protein AYI69_g4505 [Smittium culicis]|uniref:Uncharacterized protein n=1 Tax=Smittium culicis TaxID=133412 RepID=A0A1R1YD60_9FUNG|nr:hypothetical protein AYI69_g4505 [Smittium culicis]